MGLNIKNVKPVCGSSLPPAPADGTVNARRSRLRSLSASFPLQIILTASQLRVLSRPKQQD